MALLNQGIGVFVDANTSATGNTAYHQWNGASQAYVTAKPGIFSNTSVEQNIEYLQNQILSMKKDIEALNYFLMLKFPEINENGNVLNVTEWKRIQDQKKKEEYELKLMIKKVEKSGYIVMKQEEADSTVFNLDDCDGK